MPSSTSFVAYASRRELGMHVPHLPKGHVSDIGISSHPSECRQTVLFPSIGEMPFRDLVAVSRLGGLGHLVIETCRRRDIKMLYLSHLNEMDSIETQRIAYAEDVKCHRCRTLMRVC